MTDCDSLCSLRGAVRATSSYCTVVSVRLESVSSQPQLLASTVVDEESVPGREEGRDEFNTVLARLQTMLGSAHQHKQQG